MLKSRAEVEAALTECHTAPGSGGHRGVNITLRKVAKAYYWKTITADVKRWVSYE